MHMSVEIDTDAGEVRKTGRLRRSGDSTVLTIPPEVLEQAGAGEGDRVTIAVPFGSSTIEVRRQQEAEE